MLSERDIKLFGRDIKLSERDNYVVRTRYYVVITTLLCCSNKILLFFVQLLLPETMISQSKFSAIRKCNTRYQWYGTNFDFEILRVVKFFRRYKVYLLKARRQ